MVGLSQTTRSTRVETPFLSDIIGVRGLSKCLESKTRQATERGPRQGPVHEHGVGVKLEVRKAAKELDTR